MSKAAKKTPVQWIALMIVDDHPMWRDTLREVLEHSGVGRVVAEASDGAEAVDRARATRPELVIMDINLPTKDGIEATRQLLHERPETKVLVLSSSDDKTQVLNAVRAGATGYMLKTARPEDVAEAAARVGRGELVFPPALSEVVLGEFRRMSVEGPPASPLNVIVADEAVIIREGLARVLAEDGFSVVARAASAKELLDAMQDESVDVLVVDERIASAPARGSTTVLEHVRAAREGVGVLVLSPDVETAAGAREEPGIGYLLKDRASHVDELTDAIARLARGESLVDPEVVNRLVDAPRKDTPLGRLTPREKEVLALMAEGRSNQGIGERLFLGPKAVEAHVRNIFTKLGLEPAPNDQRRVLAVITYLRSTS